MGIGGVNGADAQTSETGRRGGSDGGGADAGAGARLQRLLGSG